MSIVEENTVDNAIQGENDVLTLEVENEVEEVINEEETEADTADILSTNQESDDGEEPSSEDLEFPSESFTDSDTSEDPFFDKKAFTLKRAKLPKQPDFLDSLKRVPNIDDISIDEELAREIALGRGDFDEPEPIEVGEEIKAEEEQSVIEVESTETTEESSSVTETSEFEFDFQSSEEEKLVPEDIQKLSEENLFEALVKLELTPIIIFEEPDIELLTRLEEARQIRKDVNTFLNGLVNAVVELVEYVDPEKVLSEKLDKVKLFKKLVTSLEANSLELKVNEFLSSKIVNYYKRLKCFRPFAVETPEQLPVDTNKFHETIEALNNLLGREAASKEVISNKIQEIEKTTGDVEEDLKEKIAQLESLIRRTFAKRGNDQLNSFVDRRIREMTSLRKEISTVRLGLVQRQHTSANLLEKMSKLENITDTLRLRDYEHMQMEEYTIQKKIEEKTERLNRVRQSFYVNTNIVAHIREKQAMLFYTTQAQREILDQAKFEKEVYRSYIFQLKLHRMRVQKEIREKSFESGLIDKPALCVDYDDTVILCTALKGKINGMKATIEKLENRVNSLRTHS